MKKTNCNNVHKNEKRIGIIKIMILIMCIIFSSLFMGCNKSETSNAINSTRVKIGYIPITHALPLYELKKQMGEDIELVKFGSWPELMEALNSGKIDGASALIELAMKAKSSGVNISAVCLGHTDGNVVIANKDKIDTVEDLKGKTIAIPNKLSTHNILVYEMLKKANMTFDDVNIVELTPTEMPVALYEKRIDAYCVAEPFGSKSVVNANGKVLFESDEIIKNSMCCGLILRNELINNDRNLAKEVVKKFAEASKKLEEDKDIARKDTKEFLKVQDEVIDSSLNYISFSRLKIQKEDYEKICDEMSEMKLLEKIPSYDDFVDNSLLEEAERDE